jgi:hypothetical protein
MAPLSHHLAKGRETNLVRPYELSQLSPFGHYVVQTKVRPDCPGLIFLGQHNGEDSGGFGCVCGIV